MNRKHFFATLFAAPLAFCAAAVKTPERRLGYRLICKVDTFHLSYDGKRDLTYKEYILWVQRQFEKEVTRNARTIQIPSRSSLYVRR